MQTIQFEPDSIGKSKEKSVVLAGQKGSPPDKTAFNLKAHKPFAIHISERKLLLAVTDLFLINFALLVSLLQRYPTILEPNELWQRLPWFIYLNFCWVVAAISFNVYDLSQAARVKSSVRVTCSAAVVTLIVFFFTPNITPPLPDSRVEIITFTVTVLSALVLGRISYIKFLVHIDVLPRALVIGAGQSGQRLARAVACSENQSRLASGSQPFQLVGFIDDDPSKRGLSYNGVPVLGDHSRLEALIEAYRPNELIVAITYLDRIHPDLFDAMLRCQENGIQITPMTTVYERVTNRLPLENTSHALNVVLPLTNRSTYRLYLGMKRLFDLGVGFIGCCLLLFVIPVVWTLNRIFSPGPLFYSQERVGKGGKVFRIIKFRSMEVDAEKNGAAVWASVRDSRVTRVGGFMRKVRLDEIPQFWNILKGDMSLIGPRPERPVFVKKLCNLMPFYRLRHSVKPGLTGWAQVEYRYTSNMEDSLVKLQYDLFYIKHQSFWLDIKIILKTVRVVLGLKGC
jgi:exopolysaccharide biosynthesis polyprenyl glycosylphosphotransferase